MFKKHKVYSVPVALAGACLLFAAHPDRGSAQEKGVKPAWLRDLDGAKKEATKSKKDLLIVFTGRGWCAHCEHLEREVFQQAAFLEVAKRDYVFVELDFTFADTQEDKAREGRYRKLQERYLVRSFPTVVLADAGGVPYAIQSGYARGTGVTKSLALIRLAQAARAQRDRSFRPWRSSSTASATCPSRSGRPWPTPAAPSGTRGCFPSARRSSTASQGRPRPRSGRPSCGASRAWTRRPWTTARRCGCGGRWAGHGSRSDP